MFRMIDNGKIPVKTVVSITTISLSGIEDVLFIDRYNDILLLKEVELRCPFAYTLVPAFFAKAHISHKLYRMKSIHSLFRI